MREKMLLSDAHKENDSDAESDDLTPNETPKGTQVASEMNPIDFVLDSKFRLLRHLQKAECNEDGSIKPEAIQRLRLLDWSFIKLFCHICNSTHGGSRQLRHHLEKNHPDEKIQQICMFCKRTFSDGSAHIKHIRNVHLHYLQYW